MDERALTERLIRYDTSERRGHPQGRRVRQGLARVARHPGRRAGDPRPAACWRRASASAQGPTVVFHGHLDVVPGARGAVRARGRGRPALRPRRLRHEGRAGRDDGRARGAARRSRTCGCVLAVVPDEESEEEIDRGTEVLIKQRLSRGDFAITGEPTDLHVGVQAKGVLAMRLEVSGHRRPRRDAVARRQRDPEGARRVPRDRVAAVRARELGPVRPALDQPRPHPRRRRAQQGARPCVIDVDIRYLPGQDPDEIRRAGLRAARRRGRAPSSTATPAIVDRNNPFVQRVERERVQACSTPRRSASGATAPPTRSASSTRASRRSSSAPSAAATTAPRSGSRSPRCRATAARWSTSCG